MYQNISENEKKKQFSEQDLITGEIIYQTSLEELIQKLGNPETRREYMEGSTGDRIVECIYEEEKINILFRDKNDGRGFTLSVVSSKNEDYIFSRNLKIGSTKKQVLEAYSKKSKVESQELDKQNKIKFGKNITDINSTGITYTLEDDVVIAISWNT